MKKQIPVWKKEHEWLKECYSQCLQSSTLNLSIAFINLFDGLAGYPTFKKRLGRQSMQYPQNVKILSNFSIKFPGNLGRVKAKISRDAVGKLRTVTVSRRIKNLVKNHCLAKSINDADWYQFRKWLEYFGVKFGRITVAVNPAYTSQNCSNCGRVVKKSLSTRTHSCKCAFELDRDWNAAINILNLALGTTGHVGTWILNPNASGDSTSTQAGVILSGQVESMNEESSRLWAQECQ